MRYATHPTLPEKPLRAHACFMHSTYTGEHVLQGSRCEASHLAHDVGLAAVDDADPAVLQAHGRALQHVARVRARVHDVQLRQHAWHAGGNSFGMTPLP